jgi:hypothetical protein
MDDIADLVRAIARDLPAEGDLSQYDDTTMAHQYKHSLWTMAAPTVRPHDVRRHHRLPTFDVTAVANKLLSTPGSTQILSDRASSTFQPLKPSRTPLRLPGPTLPKPSSPQKTPASSTPIAPPPPLEHHVNEPQYRDIAPVVSRGLTALGLDVRSSAPLTSVDPTSVLERQNWKSR